MEDIHSSDCRKMGWGRGREGEEVEVEKVGRGREGEEGVEGEQEWKREGWEMRGEKGRRRVGSGKNGKKWDGGGGDRQECLTQKGHQ